MTKPVSAMLVLAFAIASVGGRADAWTCRNDMEVQCGPKACSVTENGGFTPMHVSFDSSGRFSVCAYSGCWEGKGAAAWNEPFLVISQKQVDWSDPNRRIDGREDILIAFSSTDRLALVKAGRFALPMHCSKEPADK